MKQISFAGKNVFAVQECSLITDYVLSVQLGNIACPALPRARYARLDRMLPFLKVPLVPAVNQVKQADLGPRTAIPSDPEPPFFNQAYLKHANGYTKMMAEDVSVGVVF